MSLVTLLPFSAYGADSAFVFNNRSAISQWRIEHAAEARLTGGGLFLKGNNYVRIAPPMGFKAPAGRMAMELRFKAPKSLIFNIRIRTADGWETAKTVRVKGRERGDKGTALNIYLGRHNGDGRTRTYINDFVVEFYSTEKIVIRLDGLRIYEPRGAALISLLWGEFWEPDFISGTTVGFVTTPGSGGVGFITMLYVLMGLSFVTVLIFYRLRRGDKARPKAAGILVIIFAAAGLLFIVRMDYNWLSIFSDDVKTLSPVDVEKRIHIVNNRDLDSFFDFIDFVKESVPSGASVRPATIVGNSPLAAIARYYLLPLEDSVKADFLWSYAEVLHIDEKSGALYDGKGGLIAPRAELFAIFAKNAALYKVIR